MMSIVQKMSSLRVQAPEWKPECIIKKPEDIVKERCEINNNENYVVTAKVTSKEEG